MEKLTKNMMVLSAATFIGLVSGVQTASANTGFNQIVDNMEQSISDIPGLITGVSYMMGILLGVLGILKIKDHVENPSSAKLQEGAVRLAAGGALFALPIVYEAMKTTIGANAEGGVDVPQVKGISFETK